MAWLSGNIHNQHFDHILLSKLFNRLHLQYYSTILRIGFHNTYRDTALRLTPNKQALYVTRYLDMHTAQVM